MSRIASEVASMPIEEIRQELAARPPEAPHEQHHLSTSDAITQHAPTPEAPQVDDLVARLRGKAKGQNVGITTHLFDAAAARIERDAERIRVLEGAVAYWRDATTHTIDRATESRAERIRALEVAHAHRLECSQSLERIVQALRGDLAASRERELALTAALRECSEYLHDATEDDREGARLAKLCREALK
jgi:hypothetical protein